MPIFKRIKFEDQCKASKKTTKLKKSWDIYGIGEMLSCFSFSLNEINTSNSLKGICEGKLGKYTRDEYF